MAALTESIVTDPAEEVNHKEAYSDARENQNESVKVEVTNDENISSTQRKAEDSPSEENETKTKFIEAPAPKVNPWTVNRPGSKPTQKHNQLSKLMTYLH